MEIISCVYNKEIASGAWSSEIFQENYANAVKLLDTNAGSAIGTALICAEHFHGSRFMMWEIVEGEVLVMEVLLGGELVNSKVCIRFGATPILSVNLTSKRVADGDVIATSVTLSIVQQDGAVHMLHAQSLDDRVSVLDQLVLAAEGSTVNFGKLASTHVVHMGPGGNRRRNQVHAPAIGGERTALRSSRGQVRSLPLDRDIVCAAWMGTDLLLLGLSKGDLLVVSVAAHSREADAGLHLGQELQLQEQLLKDRGGGFQALLSGILGSTTDANCDTIAVAAHSGTALAANRSGELRAWSTVSQQLVAQISLSDLLEGDSEVEVANPRRTANGADRRTILQDCLVRLGHDGAGAAANDAPRYLLAAVAVLPEPSHFGASGVPVGQGAGLVAGSIPLSQQSWQVLLLGWRESAGASTGMAEKPKLIAQPIQFPRGARCGCDEFAPVYNYRSASLVDVQLTVDEERGVAVVTTCWRAEAVAHGLGLEPMVFESLIGRTEVSLQDLRREQYCPGGHTAAGPPRLTELVAPGEMILTVRGAELDRLRLRAEDEAVRRHLEESCRSAAALDDARAQERAVESSMLQRIFFSRRFADRTICMAYDALRLRYLRSEGSYEEGVDTAAPLSLDKSTPLDRLPSLVVQLCRRVVSERLQRTHGGAAISDLTLGRGHSIRRPTEAHQSFLQVLLDTYLTFLSECERASAAAMKSSAGGLGVTSETGGVAILGLPNGAYMVTCGAGVRAVDPVHTHSSRQTSRLLDLVESQVASRSELRTALTELSCLMDSYIGQGGVTDGSVQWVEQYFASIVPSLHDLIAALPMLTGTACFDDLLDWLTTVAEWQQGAGLAVESLAGTAVLASETGTAPRCSASALQLVLAVLRQRVHRSMLSLLLFSAYLHGASARLSGEVASSLRCTYIPAAVRTLLHYSTVLWMDARRPTDSHMLRHHVELSGLLPYGLIGPDAALPVAVEKGRSVLENFVQHRCGSSIVGDASENAAAGVLALMVPSVHSPLAAYLFRAGQYLCLSRLSAVALLSVGESDTPFALDLGSPVPHTLLAAAARLGGRSVQLTAELYELLRVQWFAVCSGPSGSSSRPGKPSRPERAVAAKVSELIACIRELSDCAADLVGAASSLDAPALSPALSPSSRLDDRTDDDNVMRTSVSEAVALLLEHARTITANCPSSRCGSAYQPYLEGTLTLATALRSLNQGDAHAHPLSLLRDSGPRAELSGTVLLRDHRAAFCDALQRAGLQDVLEIIDRALPLLPRAFGAALAQEGAQQQVTVVAQTLDSLPPDASVKAGVGLRGLLAELHSAWSRVFEYALLHGRRYEDALDALLRVAELEEQRLVDAAVQSQAGVTWRDALRSLVAQACEAGCLGWLCSIPEQQLEGFAKQGVSLGDAIGATLETLAATFDLPSAGGTAVNYCECLFVFQLSRRNYQDGARALHSLCSRSDAVRTVKSPAHLQQEAECLAATAQALLVLPVNQHFLLHRAPTASPLPPAAVHYCTVASLREEFVAKSLLLSALHTDPSTPGTSAAPQHILALCNAGRILEALSAAAVLDSRDARAGGHLTDIPLIALAKICIGGPESGAFSDKLMLHRFQRSSLSMVAPSSAGDNDNPHWSTLVEALRVLRRRGQDKYEVAVRAALSFSAAAGRTTDNLLPRPLVDDMCHMQVIAQSGADPALFASAAADLLAALMDRDCLAEACSVATRLVRLSDDLVAARGADAAHGGRLWMSYGGLDRLIAMCEEQLRNGETHRGLLASSFADFSKALSNHFAAMLVA